MPSVTVPTLVGLLSGDVVDRGPYFITKNQGTRSHKQKYICCENDSESLKFGLTQKIQKIETDI